ncbi:MAG: vitamin K epoxide reductase family protein [Bacteroidales bacterium]
MVVNRWWRWTFAGLNLLAIGLSILLSWQVLSGDGMPGCGGESSCNEVLSSRWSKWAGVIPVGLPAVSVYLAIWVAVSFLTSNAERSVRCLAWIALLVLAGVVIGSAIWFFIVQRWIIGAYCLWCMTTHVAGILLSLMILRRAWAEYEPRFALLAYVLGGLFLAMLFAALQALFLPSAVFVEGRSQEALPVIDPQSAPRVGPVEAPHVVTLLFDYQCLHCRRLHFMLPEVVSMYKGELAFILCPTPLSPQCNRFVPREVESFANSCELARLGLIVWQTQRERFAEFEAWMFSYESGDKWHPRTLEAARAKVIGWMGQTAFQEAVGNQSVSLYLEQSVNLFGKTLMQGKGAIPRLIYGSRWVTPNPSDAADLARILQESLALPPIPARSAENQSVEPKL